MDSPQFSWSLADFKLVNLTRNKQTRCVQGLTSLDWRTRGFLHNDKHLLNSKIAPWGATGGGRSSGCAHVMIQRVCVHVCVGTVAHKGHISCTSHYNVVRSLTSTFHTRRSATLNVHRITWSSLSSESAPEADPEKRSGWCHKMCPVPDNGDQITSDISFCVPGRPSQRWHDITNAQSFAGKKQNPALGGWLVSTADCKRWLMSQKCVPS